MLLIRVVETSQTLRALPGRNDKIEAIAELLTDPTPVDAGLVVSYLTASPRQGRTGVGWAQISGLDVEWADTPSLHLTDIDALFTDLGEISGTGSRDRRKERLTVTFERATVAEQDFLSRLIIGEIHHGALEGVLADAIALATGIAPTVVRRAAMLSGDLARTAARAVNGGERALRDTRLRVGVAVQPMLASSAPAVDHAVGLVTIPARVEWKLDGVRIQVHVDESSTRVFSRNLNDITDQLAGVVEQCRRFSARRFVLDGEAILLGENDRPSAFQDTASNRGELVSFFFDILHLDGEDLIDHPLSVRHQHLADTVGEHLIPGRWVDGVDAANAVFEESLNAGHEGCVIKSGGAPYAAGRRGKSWVKVKPVHTFDLIVLGAEWGHGRRTGWLSNLHLGARDGEATVMVGKTFKGLTDELLTWQTARLLELERSRDDHMIEVEPTLIVEVAIDGVQRSTRYPGGLALRFARVRRYRDDKSLEQADSIDALRQLLDR